MTLSRIAASGTVRAIGPAWSSEEANATMPQREHRPYVGLMPTVAVNAAGWRIDPPVSVAVAPMHSIAAPADAEPPEEPPGTKFVLAPSRRHGLATGPKHEVSFEEPIANSSLLSLPSRTAPSRQSCEVTVDS